MFTGIITDIGRVLDMKQEGDLRARIGCAYDIDGIDIGASIACNGVCLTVIALGTTWQDAPQNWFDVQISAESVDLTNIGDWTVGAPLNLERALKLGDELGGHIVSGHVDGVAELIEMRDEGDSTRLTFRAPEALAKFIAPKGSVALNGTSLTVNEVEGCDFGINVIPHTQEVTIWGKAKVGDRINLEIDTVARYVARLQDWDK
ncbi:MULTISPECIES: riboflavin synthase [Pacificibacter]|uniref:riboflavin synthase n=1 Tax=Pacificibacter TaxID=1042323 RepID=UPI001C08C663|nr:MULTISPECIES: riboflavin synthase [Pacificibacter]MBU2935437.1 riboflavin synthase [Pacificibacter marinus]MDO6615591.1 riboflavin synthase [Pacificibacter sp. 1_MG-2023]